jgi:hypothetical protein
MAALFGAIVAVFLWVFRGFRPGEKAPDVPPQVFNPPPSPTGTSPLIFNTGISQDIKGQISKILPLIAEICNDVMPQNVIFITSTTGGQHMIGSLHYEGLAVDFDIPTWTDSERSDIANKLANRLPRQYDVVDEGTHIHVEYDS